MRNQCILIKEILLRHQTCAHGYEVSVNAVQVYLENGERGANIFLKTFYVARCTFLRLFLLLSLHISSASSYLCSGLKVLAHLAVIRGVCVCVAVRCRCVTCFFYASCTLHCSDQSLNDL